jgi:hypothetical protein
MPYASKARREAEIVLTFICVLYERFSDCYRHFPKIPNE